MFLIFGIFGFGKKKEAQRAPRESRGESAQRIRDLESELDGLRTELEHLSEKLNVELRTGDGDRTTTLSRYPRRIVEVKIRIDEIERKLKSLGAP